MRIAKRKMGWLTGALLLWLAAAPLAQAFYNPTTGRWISRDPIEEKGGVNVHAFCKNDPMGSVDILGREPLAGTQKWVPLKKDDPGACQYGDKIKFAADFLVNSKCEPTTMLTLSLASFEPCAIKRFAWPVDCVCKGMSDSTEDQCIRGCLKDKYDTTGTFPTISDHLSCVGQCNSSSSGVVDFLSRVGPVLEACAKSANCLVGAATTNGGLPGQYEGECKDKKGCGTPCCGRRTKVW